MNYIIKRPGNSYQPKISFDELACTLKKLKKNAKKEPRTIAIGY
jgi:hypothetical protein